MTKSGDRRDYEDHHWSHCITEFWKQGKAKQGERVRHEQPCILENTFRT